MRRIPVHTGGALAAQADLDVDPQGKVIKCRVTRLKGASEFNSPGICEAMKRAKFKAAVGPDGQNVHSRMEIVFSVFGMKVPERIPEVTMTVKDLPGGATEADTHVKVVVDAEGAIAYCATNSHEDSTPDLVASACEGLQSYAAVPLVGKDGTSVPYVNDLSVHLIVQRAAPTAASP